MDAVSIHTDPVAELSPADHPVWKVNWLSPWTCRLLFVALLAFGFWGHYRYLTLNCPVDLSGDEAQYWDWSRQLDLSYYSKGPLVAYLIRASCTTFGTDTMFAVRFPAVLLGAGTSILTYLLTRKLFGSDRLALGVMLLYHVVPLFAAGSVLMTIDPPFYFFWALATYLTALAVFDNRRWAWPAIGAAAGLGFLAKYAMLLWFLPLVLFMATDSSARRQLRSAGPWVAMGVALLFLTPVVIWNAQHGWVTLRHVSTQTGTGSAGKFHLHNLFEFVGGQMAIVGPGLFVMMVAGVLYTCRPWPRDIAVMRTRTRRYSEEPTPQATLDYGTESAEKTFARRLGSIAAAITSPARRLLLKITPAARAPEPYWREMRLLAWFGVAFFGVNFLAAFRTKVQLNWPVPAYFTLMILTVYFLATRLRDRQTWRPWRWWFYLTVAIGLFLMPLAHNMELVYPAVRWVNAHAGAWRKQKDYRLLAWLGQRLPKTEITADKIDFTARLKGWDELGDRLSTEVESMGKNAFVMCDEYQEAAEMAFYMKGQPKTFYVGSYYQGDPKRLTQYDIWPDRTLTPPNPRIGCNAIYLGHIDRPIGDLLRAFDRVEGVTIIKTRMIGGQWITRPEQRAIELPIERDGVHVRTFRYFKCYNFKGIVRAAGKDSY